MASTALGQGWPVLCERRHPWRTVRCRRTEGWNRRCLAEVRRVRTANIGFGMRRCFAQSLQGHTSQPESIPGALLRNNSPDLVWQELHVPMSAHHAILSLIHGATERVGEDSGRLSLSRNRECLPTPRLPSRACPTVRTKSTERNILEGVLEERAVASREQIKPRGVKRNVSDHGI